MKKTYTSSFNMDCLWSRNRTLFFPNVDDDEYVPFEMVSEARFIDYDDRLTSMVKFIDIVNFLKINHENFNEFVC